MPRFVGLLAVVVTAVCAFGAAPASAKVVFPSKGEITEAGCCVESFKSEAVAFNDHNGHVYVADSQEHVIRDYSSASDTTPEVWNGGSSVHGGGTPAGLFEGALAVAVDNSTGDVYVADSSHAVIDKFDQDGNLITAFGDTTPTANGQLAGLETPAGTFSPASVGSFGIAVNQVTGDLYAIDAGHEVIDVFGSTGAYLKQISGEPAPFGCGGAYTDGVAVNDQSEEVLISDSCDLKIYRFDRTSGTLLGVIDGSETPSGNFGGGFASVAADNASGDIYVTDTSHEVVDRYKPDGTYSGTQISGTPQGQGGAVAVDQASGDIYVAQSERQLVKVFGPPVVVPDIATTPAEVHSVTSATLNGEVNPAGLPVTECFFEYGESTAYGETALCGEDPVNEIGEGNTPVPVDADITNLQPGATYHYRLVAANANGANSESGDQVFFTGASIDSTSASQVTATSATLETELNPHRLPTTYHFEYDTFPYAEGEASHGTATATASAGSGTADVTHTASIGALQPSTTYHFRVLATNSLGTVEGPDRSFTTQPTSAASLLPDSRAYELVSPPDKHGSPLESIPPEGGPIQAAADGSGLAYIATAPIDTDPGGSRSALNTTLLARRTGGPGTWSTTDVSTPHQAPEGLVAGQPAEYKLFSTDLSLGLVQPQGATPLSPQTTEKTPYLRQPDGSYTPLVTAAPGFANVPPGTEFGGEEAAPESFGGPVDFVTATPDLSHLLLKSPKALTAEFSPAYQPTYTSPRNVYEWSAGALRLVSQIPIGSATSCGGTGPTCVPASEEGRESDVGNISAQVRGALSSAGSRAVFSTGGGLAGSPSLYLRDLTAGETLALDVLRGGPGESGGATFQLASADGRRIFFTDSQRLTAGSTAANGKPDLYMCQIEETPGGLVCTLTDLTANAVNPAEPADVQGDVIGAAEDGSSVYFVANGDLDGTGPATAGNCDLVGGGEGGAPAVVLTGCNLYRYDTATQETSLLAVLSGADYPDWAATDPSNLGRLTARVSPNGRYLAFMSQRPLTGYDNRDAASGARDQEVFVYDSQADGGQGRLACASCNPSGARPRGVFDSGGFPGLLVDRRGNWGPAAGNQTLAANVPGWTPKAGPSALYQSRYLSDSGRLFFNAADALAPSDSNGVFDVYQFEFPGGPGQPTSNTCTTAASTYSPASGGCVSLISSGTSPEESAFLDASENGDDVFFLTASKLVSKDVDKALDIYDTRVGGGEPSVVKPVECSGDACQQPAVPPNDQTPGSLTFNGAGNVLECPKGKVKKSGKCVKKQSKKKKSHKKKGKGNAHRASHNRGGAK